MTQTELKSCIDRQFKAHSNWKIMAVLREVATEANIPLSRIIRFHYSNAQRKRSYLDRVTQRAIRREFHRLSEIFVNLTKKQLWAILAKRFRKSEATIKSIVRRYGNYC